MVYLIDINILVELDITANDAIIMLTRYHKKAKNNSIIETNEILESLQKKGFIKIVENGFYLRSKGNNYCKEVTVIQKTSTKNIKDDIEEWIDEYRKLFKVKHIPGKMGDRKGAIEKMRKFYTEYPDYADKELIFKMANIYINKEKNKTYQMQADYFIFKQEKGIWRSKLAAFCEENEIDEIKESNTVTGKQDNTIYL